MTAGKLSLSFTQGQPRSQLQERQDANPGLLLSDAHTANEERCGRALNVPKVRGVGWGAVTLPLDMNFVV